MAARKGDTRVEVDSPEACRVGEVVLLGEHEAKMVIDKGSLVFRLPLERDYPGPEGMIVRPWAENEFQAEGDRLCVYRRGHEDDIHFVCYVDLLERSNLERADPTDEAQNRAYAEDLEARIQRIIDAREATRATGAGGGGVMVPPLSSGHEWGQPLRARAMGIPAFGHEASGDIHREGAGEAEQGPRGSGEQEGGREGKGQPATSYKGQTGRLCGYFRSSRMGKGASGYGNGRLARSGSSQRPRRGS